MLASSSVTLQLNIYDYYWWDTWVLSSFPDSPLNDLLFACAGWRMRLDNERTIRKRPQCEARSSILLVGSVREERACPGVSVRFNQSYPGRNEAMICDQPAGVMSNGVCGRADGEGRYYPGQDGSDMPDGGQESANFDEDTALSRRMSYCNTSRFSGLRQPNQSEAEPIESYVDWRTRQPFVCVSGVTKMDRSQMNSNGVKQLQGFVKQYEHARATIEGSKNLIVERIHTSENEMESVRMPEGKLTDGNG
ncbi:uncharacterized protein EV420DRAFT_1476505 [Desarmillaria tabescens]|uniref:Uncharacterized protein n=1 Tax=Armillaria tabescens TaxID=1929756 RepID=A0AA39NDZ2_ARMTA|nr:uncharacterized protein EV420DRAFT_1476505 [Desarmillaria tabescens]KAK0463851.1 hypothetical protein EV420DRAFT_1476505 [Desarmillaria tabescens]